MRIKVKVGKVEVDVDGIEPRYSTGMAPHWISQLEELITRTIAEAVEWALAADRASAAQAGIGAAKPVPANEVSRTERSEPPTHAVAVIGDAPISPPET